MKKHLIFCLLVFLNLTYGQQLDDGATIFWDQLQKICGQAFEGSITEALANDDFRGKTLIMHVRSCEPNRVRIPFFVGDDRSRTWILTLENKRITLKHDHRHENGAEDEITQYGGTSSNSGKADLQMFPADPFTCNMIGYACSNLWWITLNETTFTYNLMRIGSNRKFSVSFDLTQAVTTPEAPWGWRD